MSAGTLETLTADELLNLPDEKNYELVEGRLVERKMGAESGLLEIEIGGRLREWARAVGGHTIGSSGGFQCFPDDNSRVVRPDVSYILPGRLETVPKGWVKIPPDLAIEIVSPTDSFSELAEKVADYLSVGVRLVWVIDPTLQEVQVHRLHGRPEILHGDDDLGDRAVLAGFSCRVAELFGNRGVAPVPE